MTSQELMDKAAMNIERTMEPIYAKWAIALMRMAYEAGRRDAEKELKS